MLMSLRKKHHLGGQIPRVLIVSPGLHPHAGTDWVVTDRSAYGNGGIQKQEKGWEVRRRAADKARLEINPVPGIFGCSQHV